MGRGLPLSRRFQKHTSFRLPGRLHWRQLTSAILWSAGFIAISKEAKYSHATGAFRRFGSIPRAGSRLGMLDALAMCGEDVAFRLLRADASTLTSPLRRRGF